MGDLRHSVVALLLVLAALLACKQRERDSSGGGSGPTPNPVILPPPPPKEVVIADEFKTVKDGEGWNYKLEKGTYRVEATATGDGITVEWTGAICMNAPTEIKVFNTTCTLTGNAQLSITNPTKFGLGKSTSITLKITKLP